MYFGINIILYGFDHILYTHTCTHTHTQRTHSSCLQPMAMCPTVLDLFLAQSLRSAAGHCIYCKEGDTERVRAIEHGTDPLLSVRVNEG